MDQSGHSSGDYIGHSTPSQHGILESTDFNDFIHPFQDMQYNSGLGSAFEANLQTHANHYNVAAGGVLSEHGDSISSVTEPQGSLGVVAVPAPQARLRSLVGSESGSPDGQVDFGDEFGLAGIGAVDGTDLGSKNKDDPTPAWTELKTKAGKERKRLPLACIACRRKKIRCSGEKPACKHCLRSRIPCVYKVTTRKAAPRTDYMAMLDKRLKRMEERIIKIVPKEEQEPSSIPRAQLKPAIPSISTGRSGKKRPVEEAFGADLDTWANSSNKKDDDDNGVPAVTHNQEAEENRLLKEGAESLPSSEIQEHLAEVFFEKLYGQAYHLLHKPSFMRKLKSGTVPPVLILAVCAVSARFSTHPKLNTNPNFLRGELWAADARSIVLKRYDWPNITILTCLLLLGLHEFGTCYGGRSWAFAGMAIRMAYALQLHKDLEHDPFKGPGLVQLSFVDREIRRRTFWAAFLMDRFTSSGTDRPMFMKEETIKVKLPIVENFFQLDMEGPAEDLIGSTQHPIADDGPLAEARNNMGVAAWTIRSIALWGRIIVYHFQGGRDVEDVPVWSPEAHFVTLTKQADEFLGQLPPKLKFTQENLDAHETEGTANQFLFMHISIMQNIVFTNYQAVHGHPGGRPPKECPQNFVNTTTMKSFEAARRISELLRAAEAYSVIAPFAGYCAFMSSSVQMAAAFSKDTVTMAMAKKNLATNVRYITKMKRYWGAFHWTSETLKDQFKVWADTTRRGTEASHSPLFHYGDWFERYPHGVSPSDFEDPAAAIKEEKGNDGVLEQKSDYYTVEEFFNTLEASNTPIQRAQSRAAKLKDKVSEPQIPFPAPQQLEQLPEHHQHPVSSQELIQISDHALPQNYLNQPHPQMFANHTFYGGQTESFFPPQQQGMAPQIDRQLVLGAYSESGMGHPSLEANNIIDNMHPVNWDMGMGTSTGTAGFESTSAWFMPFNLEPPNPGRSGEEIFPSLANPSAVAYGMEMGTDVYSRNSGQGMGGGGT